MQTYAITNVGNLVRVHWVEDVDADRCSEYGEVQLIGHIERCCLTCGGWHRLRHSMEKTYTEGESLEALGREVLDYFRKR